MFSRTIIVKNIPKSLTYTVGSSCVRALVSRLMACCLFLLGHGGRDPRLNAREEVGSPHLPPKKNTNYQLSAGLGGRAESAGLPSTSHPPALSQRTPCVRAPCTHALCTHALCARTHKTQYPLDTKRLCTRACVQAHGRAVSFYLVMGVEILVSTPERRWAPRTSPQHPGALLD